MDADYPSWFHFPSRQRPPEWATRFVEAVESRRGAIDSAVVDGLTSDAVLAALAPALVPLGYRVEDAKLDAMLDLCPDPASATPPALAEGS